MIFKPQLLSNFNRYPNATCEIARPQQYNELFEFTSPCIVRGQGLSYSDAALLPEAVIETSRLNRFLAFDKKTGRLKVEAGIRICDILPIIIPAGWFLPVTPGTEYASMGGCVACNVHGKNQAKQGNFGEHVISFTLITADQKSITCSIDENPIVFKATLGGMGLTGIIAEVELQLMPIESSYMNVQTQVVNNLAILLSRLSNLAHEEDYAVAWVNPSSDFKQHCSGIISAAHHVKMTELASQQQVSALGYEASEPWSIPKITPSKIINSYILNYFNKWYERHNARKTAPYLQSITEFFYPLDKLTNWNYLLGKQGFIQYQCYLPTPHAEIGTQQLLEILQNTKLLSPLITIKYFGNATDPSGLTFSGTGYTIAIDIIINNEIIWEALQKFDEIVISHHGKVYLAKDVRLSAETFRAMYPAYPDWLTHKKSIDPNFNFTSSMAKRLKIGA